MSVSSPSPSPHNSRTILEHIAFQMAFSLDLQVVLATITQGLVDELDAAFARIWLLGPADLCVRCYKSADCMNRARCLHLVASAGIYANLNGEYRRIPLGALKIGKIAQGWGALYTNDLLGDDRLPNKEWMKQNLLRSFAGFPQMFRGELLGVLAMFGRRPLSDDEFGRMAIFAHEAAYPLRTRSSSKKWSDSRTGSRLKTSPCCEKNSNSSTILRRWWATVLP
ncbi:MAG: GAF domain-containing protein [Nitrospira sp.]|nr:GAF domain-containing protein [Nitrospira sp.]